MAVTGGPRPSEIMHARRLPQRAWCVLQAVGGSTNGADPSGRHRRPARPCRSTLPSSTGSGARRRCWSTSSPPAQHYMEHFHHAGGVPRLLAELRDLLDLDRADRDRRHAGRRRSPQRRRVARPGRDPAAVEPDLKARRRAWRCCAATSRPRGAVIKQSAATPALLQHTGRAVVFDSLEDLAARIDDPDARRHGRRRAGAAATPGPKGAPGMPEAGYLPIPRKLARQGVKDMVRISDARMSGTAFGTIVLHITPEAADRRAAGAGAHRRPHPARRGRPAARPAGRRGRAGRAGAQPRRRRRSRRRERGYARLFHDSVLQADEGCDFDFLVPGRKAG